MLKLVRTPLNVYFTAFKSIFLSLFAPITSDECHAWFFERGQSSCEERGTSEHYKKILSTVGFEPQTHTSIFPACPSNHSATWTVDDMRLELLQYLFTLRY